MDNTEITLDTEEKKGTALSKYSLEYLNKILKVCFTEHLLLESGTDYPLRISYTNHGQSIKYILAPRIEND